MITLVCHWWRHQNVEVLTADGKILRCHGTSWLTKCCPPVGVHILWAWPTSWDPNQQWHHIYQPTLGCTALILMCLQTSGETGIVKRSHRSMKTIAVRKQCFTLKVVYWFNATPKDSVSTYTPPSNIIYTYNVHIQGIDTVANPEPQDAHRQYWVGDAVWVRIPYSRCMSKSRIDWVTRINSSQSVLVDVISHHVKDLRLFPEVCVSFSITSKWPEEGEQLSRPWSVSPDDASDKYLGSYQRWCWWTTWRSSWMCFGQRRGHSSPL